jgi:DME family drug/metabolite transporter
MNRTKTMNTSMQASQTLALLSACGAGVLWGTGALVVNVLIAQHGFTPQSISFWRFGIGAVVLVMVFGRRIVWKKLKPLLLTVFLSGLAMAGYVLLWFLGIEYMGAAIPTLIALCLPPVIVTIIAVIRGQERVDVSLVLVLVGAVIGTLLIILKQEASLQGVDSHKTLFGILFSIGSALLYAGFSMVSGRISIALGAGPATACITVVAAGVMSFFALYQPFIWPTDIPPQAWFLYLGVVTAALALLAFSWGAARLKPTALTIATLLEPLTAMVLSALLLHQHLSAWQWVGSVLLLISIWLLGKRK